MDVCKEYLKAFRKTIGAKPNERIDKRYSTWLAPNGKIYDNAHCAYCAEVEYLAEIYNQAEADRNIPTSPR